MPASLDSYRKNYSNFNKFCNFYTVTFLILIKHFLYIPAICDLNIYFTPTPHYFCGGICHHRKLRRGISPIFPLFCFGTKKQVRQRKWATQDCSSFDKPLRVSPLLRLLRISTKTFSIFCNFRFKSIFGGAPLIHHLPFYRSAEGANIIFK